MHKFPFASLKKRKSRHLPAMIMISLLPSEGILNCVILCEMGADQQIAQGKVGFDIGPERRRSISGFVS
jgi:hypothetical protein